MRVALLHEKSTDESLNDKVGGSTKGGGHPTDLGLLLDGKSWLQQRPGGSAR